MTHAALMCLIDSASSRTHSRQPGVPYDIQPRINFETFKPELPRRTEWSLGLIAGNESSLRALP